MQKCLQNISSQCVVIRRQINAVQLKVIYNKVCILRQLPQLYSTKHQETELVRHLVSRIKANGPIPVADYMKAVLTDPSSGYYMHRDVFGTKGDFITSPEISQMFGELIGVWCVSEWMQCGSAQQVNVVELGPGRGTLVDDMLRVFSQFKKMKESVSIHLVEVSPKMSQIQLNKLSGRPTEESQQDTPSLEGELYYRRCESRYGPPIYWYKQIQDVPQAFSIFIAHEFFDALPIHKFQRTERGWCEICVDLDTGEDSKLFKFVLSPGPTIASSSLLQVDEGDVREHIEVCPDGGVIVQQMATRISSHGGAALIADYGHNGEKTDTFRGFKQHQLHDVLVDPGSADLTADVDFSYLRRMTADTAKTHGPITQENFLHNMGIGLRLKVLMENAGPNARKDLISGYDMLTNPQKMGERFKFFALTKERDYIPAGFVKPS